MKKTKIETVSMTEFRRHFGKYMDKVIKGTTIVLTRYGKKVARLCPVDDSEISHDGAGV